MDLGQRILAGLDAAKRKKDAAQAGNPQASIDEVVAQVEGVPRPVAAAVERTAAAEPVQAKPSVDIEAFKKRLDRISERMKFGERK